MQTRSAKRRRKISLPGGQSVDQRRPNDPKRVKVEDPRMTVAVSRMRHSGVADVQEAVQPIMGTEVGLCIRSLATGDDRLAICDTWQAISAAYRNHAMLVIGRTGDPQGAAIAMVPEAMETNQSMHVDLRTHDERVSSAKRLWGDWCRKLKDLPAPPLRWSVEGALRGFMGDGRLWRDQAPTATGKTLVMALRLLAKDGA